MKNFLSFLTLVFALLIAGSSIAADTVAKINFSQRDGDYEQEGWTSVYGTESTFPIDLGNGLTLVKVDYSTPHMGDSYLDDIGAEIEGFPANVQNSANYLANTDNAYTIGMKITGLDPSAKYTFDIYSRAWGTTEKISKFSVGDSDTITVVSTLNEEVIYFTDLQPDANGEITLDITKLPGGYAFINGWIVTRQEESIPQVNTDDAYVKINFTADGNENNDWPSIYGNSSLPATVDNNVVVDITNGTLNGGDSGEPVNSLPENVGSTYNYLSSGDNDAVILTFTGLDPNFMYTFDIFASRNSATSSGDKTTFFSIEDDTVSIDALGNTDVLLSIENVQVPASGIIELTIDRPDGQAGYINALIITKGMEFVNTNGAYTKVNFTADGYEQDGWPSVYGNSSLPVTIDNGIVMDITGGTLNGGPNGEPATSLPENVGPTYNYLSSGDNDAVILTFSGLDPGFMYTFDIFASRNSASSSGDKTTFFSIEDDTVSIDALGNTDVLLSIENVKVPASGIVELTIDRPDGQAGYINALIITKGIEIITADNAFAKINFTADGYENNDWPSIYGNSSLPATIDNNIVVDITGGTLNGGTSGEPINSFPENVGSTYNYLSSSDNDAVVLTFSGLDPNLMYTFDIFASRNSATSSGDKTTSFTIGSSTVSIDALGNTDVLLSLENVQVPASGVVELTIDRPDGQAGYINALIINKQGENIALNKPASATSIEGSNFIAQFAFDGDLNTRWASAETDTDFETICVDLEGPCDITKMVLSWEAAFGMAYTIDVSDDSTNWTTLFSTTEGDGGFDIIKVNGTGRYVRMDATDRGTEYAYSLYEFEVYGTEKTSTTTTGDTIAKINFTDESGDYIQEGWTSVVGTKSAYPLDLGNGLSLYKVDGIYPHLGDSYLDDIGAEIDGFPANVQNSANYLANTDEAYTIGFKITGLDPNETYKFDIYSRAWGTTEKISKFSVFEGDTITILSTLNEEVISFENLEPNTAGELTLSVTKLPGGYAFINGWIITQEGVPDNVKEINSSNIKLYPNPASDYVQIDNMAANSIVSVFNIAGKKMIEKTNGFDSKTMVDVKNLKNGIYLIRVIDSNAAVSTFKVIKK